MLIRWRARRLNDENIRSANVLSDLEIEFAVGKSLRTRLAEIAAQMRADLFRQRRMRIARENFYVAGYAHCVGGQYSVISGQFKYSRPLITELTTQKEKAASFYKQSRIPICEMAGAEGFEPANAGSKDRCLTTWLRPNYFRN